MVQPGHGCVHEHCVRSNPGYARQCVFARDHGVCALCGLQSVYWEADHTIPVIEGGGECGLEGLRTLCSGCHKLETAALAARRAQRRKEDREE
jgi:5-methylcytosine-specific restriction endonuclease McrA